MIVLKRLLLVLLVVPLSVQAQEVTGKVKWEEQIKQLIERDFAESDPTSDIDAHFGTDGGAEMGALPEIECTGEYCPAGAGANEEPSENEVPAAAANPGVLSAYNKLYDNTATNQALDSNLSKSRMVKAVTMALTEPVVGQTALSVDNLVHTQQSLALQTDQFVRHAYAQIPGSLPLSDSYNRCMNEQMGAGLALYDALTKCLEPEVTAAGQQGVAKAAAAYKIVSGPTGASQISYTCSIKNINESGGIAKLSEMLFLCTFKKDTTEPAEGMKELAAEFTKRYGDIHWEYKEKKDSKGKGLFERRILGTAPKMYEEDKLRRFNAILSMLKTYCDAHNKNAQDTNSNLIRTKLESNDFEKTFVQNEDNLKALSVPGMPFSQAYVNLFVSLFENEFPISAQSGTMDCKAVEEPVVTFKEWDKSIKGRQLFRTALQFAKVTAFIHTLQGALLAQRSIDDVARTRGSISDLPLLNDAYALIYSSVGVRSGDLAGTMADNILLAKNLLEAEFRRIQDRGTRAAQSQGWVFSD